LLSNVIQVFLESNQLESAKKYIDIMYDHLQGSRYLYEKIKCDFLLGCYHYLAGNHDEGFKQAQQAVNLMKVLGLEKEAVAHKQYVNELVNATK